MPRKSALALMLVLTGCETVPVPPEKLALPSARLMTPPTPLPTVKKGANLYEEASFCRAEYGRVAGKLTGLQGYVKTIHKDRPK